MSTVLMDERFTTKCMPNHNCSRILKSRENIIKLKCSKSLRKKLKKYKLRKGGQEDPDIIAVSQTLINCLRIKSPNKQNFYSQRTDEENRPNNYITKMVRLKKMVREMESTPTSVQIHTIESKDESISLTTKDDHDKKQTDAFKLLMDSRNKSIGSNSPGKEIFEEDTELQGKEEKSKLRVKRILSLNRMAQAKGSLKKLEIEEYRTENIKRKMEDRAKRLKHMIVDVDAKNGHKIKIKPSIDKLVEKSSSSMSSEKVDDNKDILNAKPPLFKTFDLFADNEVNLNSNMKKMSKEDANFLKKLSPSIRKKENMLCYFQKVVKDSETLQNDDDTGPENRDGLIIKVKLKSRNNLPKKKNKVITGNEINLSKSSEQDQEITKQAHKSDISDTNDYSKKRKRNDNNQPGKKEIRDNSVTNEMQYKDSRPKRNTKNPVKYSDDFQLISSDEELHIFTPKKKRKEKVQYERNLKPLIDNTKEQIHLEKCGIIEKDIKSKPKKGKDIKKKLLEHEQHVPKKVPKLAPIFVTKPLPDAAAIEAKQKFLQSGVPSKLKKSSTHQINMLATDEFPIVVHIQHLNCLNNLISDNFYESTINNIQLNTIYAEDINLNEEEDVFKKLLQVPFSENYCIPKLQQNVDQILDDIKKMFPKFPVYRTYHLLRGKSKGEFKDCIYPDLDNSVEILNNIVDINNVHPDKLSWVDKYKPTTEKQVIGNFESIRELKRWLVSWTENTNSKMSKVGSDSSDFYQSDTDSRDTMKNENNLLIITGKAGTGKTLSVYAVAAELAIKVIEVNASTKRTGKIMIQDLLEATQSHKVDRGKNSSECSQKLQDINVTNNLLTVTKKRGRKKKVPVDCISKDKITGKKSSEVTIIQDNVRTGMSLILIDDADIVFDQDDGFCYAISQLIQSSKRPVILVTSSLSCPHLQKFSCGAKIIKMRPFLPRMLGTWLDLMCLVDNNVCSPGLGAKTLDLFKGDIRKTINYLQFYMTSHRHLSNMDDLRIYQNEEIFKVNGDDENSCMSWGDKEGWGDKNIVSSNSNDICKYFVSRETELSHYSSCTNNFYVWWNLPDLLNFSSKNYTNEQFGLKDNIKETEKLHKIANVLDSVSITDYLGNLDVKPYLASGPWQSFEMDSVIDNENFASYNKSKESIKEISWELMIKSIAEAQKVIDAGNKTEINYPSMSLQRERDKVISRHKTLANSLNPSTALDRRALALDYWSSCRLICRAEKSKTNNHSKRNNRFCHYLKSLNIVGRNEYFDNLGDSLSFKS